MWKRSLVAGLTAASFGMSGCSTPAPKVQAGPYQGFFGEEDGMKKVGMDGVLLLREGKLTGTCVVTMADREVFTGNGTVTVDTSGSRVKMLVVGAPEKFTINIEADWTEEGSGRLRGEAVLVDGPDVLKRGFEKVRSNRIKEPGKVPFLWKIQSERS